MESNVVETKQAGNSKPIMTMEDIIGELKLFYFAGMDTTAVLLTWTMVVLSMHPAAPCEGGGPARLRRQPPGLGRHTPTENRQYSPATARTSLQLEMEF